VSPLSLRRYRADRLLRREFHGLREGVLASVARRLRAHGAMLDRSDLEVCYAIAWQGLYSLTVDGEHVENPAGWLALVTYRRAIDEQRARSRLVAHASGRLIAGAGSDAGRDLAAELDDRARLRQLFEALRGRLSERELQAATLCYLHGLTRAEAAERMDVSQSRMRKLMEGANGRPGVATKVGALVDTIRKGSWCEEQDSLMRGLAFGVLDPHGERYALALAHRDECPACRAYVLSLRGLAALLPPAPLLARAILGSLGSGAVAQRPAGAGAGVHANGAVKLAVGARASSGGALGSSGAAGSAAGTAGGGWLLAGGGAATKLAVGCLVAAGVGASCAALTLLPAPRPHAGHRSRSGDHRAAGATAGIPRSAAAPARVIAPSVARSRSTARAAAAVGGGGTTAATRASQEFGLEQPAAAAKHMSPGAGRAATSDGHASSAAEARERPPVDRATPPARPSSAGRASAQREFGIG
jgi:DNA-directed RNA polymerase specialized sigma24 family protein